MVKKIKEDVEVTIDTRPTLFLQDMPAGENLADKHWVYNPMNYTQLRGDFSLLQQRVLFGVLDHLQKRILDSISQYREEREFPDVFNDMEVDTYSNVKIRISLSSLGVSSNHYKELRLAIQNLMSAHVQIVRYDEKSRNERLNFLSLFTSIDMPTSGVTARHPYKPGEKISYFADYIDIYMPIKNLRDIFSLNKGFIKHYSHIVNIARSKYTPKMYVKLSAFRDIGHVRLPYDELLKDFSLAQEVNGKLEIKSTFTQWNRVRNKILEPIREEIKHLADENNINIYFEYAPVFPDGKKRGTPSAIDFKIIKSGLGREDDALRKRNNMARAFVKWLLEWCSDIRKTDAVKIVDGVPLEVLQHLTDYGYKEVKKNVEKYQPDNVASYALSLLHRKREALLRPAVKQLDLFAPSEAQSEPKESIKVLGEYAQEWTHILNAYDGKFKPYLLRAKHRGSYCGSLWIDFPNAKLRDEFNELRYAPANKAEYSQLMAVIKSVIGEKKGRNLVCGCPY